jgi:hypothetical protein
MELTELGITMLTKLVIVMFTPIFVFQIIFVCYFGLFLGNLYLRELSVKHEMRYAITVLPLYSVDILCYSAMHVPFYWLTLVQLRV